MTSYVKQHVRKDGTVATYTYQRKSSAAPIAKTADSIAALIDAFQLSPEWAEFSPSTRKNYVIYLRELYAFGNTPAADIKRTQVLTLRDAIAKGRGHGAATGYVHAVSGLFNWALDRRWPGIEQNPAYNARKGLKRGHHAPWTRLEADVALARLPEPLRRVVVLGAYTGARRSDLCKLTWADYDGETLTYVPTKTKHLSLEPIVVPCDAPLRAELDAWKQDAGPTAHILTAERGRPWEPNHLSELLPKTLRKIGISTRLNVHGLRKLFATTLADESCPVHEIAAAGGWKTLAMVQLYTDSANRRKLTRAAFARLADLRNGAPVDNVRSFRSTSCEMRKDTKKSVA